VVEQVLVVERKTIDNIGAFQGFTHEVDRYFTIFENAFFMDRSKAEKDPSHKQIIPYVIFEYNGKYLSYIRGKEGGEARLVGGRSIGIGGHINPVDASPSPFIHNDIYDTAYEATFYRKAYSEAVEREVNEEVSVKSAYTDKIIALINDDSNEVGSVHLGIVHLRKLQLPEIVSNESMISDLTFMSRAELIKNRNTLETWSSLCVDVLGLENLWK